jgi:hypothetical protein
MTAESRRLTLSTLCGCVVAACSILREQYPARAADWISIARRTVTLARMEGLSIPLVSLAEVRVAEQDCRRYLECQAGVLPHFSRAQIAEEIAHMAEGAVRRSRLGADRAAA